MKFTVEVTIALVFTFTRSDDFIIDICHHLM